jgi:UDP-N-acetylglucosamine acyltransferase
MSVFIHPTSIVETDDIGDGTYIGPYCYVTKRSVIGKNCNLVAYCSIGTPGEHPHDPDDRGGMVYIDDETEIREFVTVNSPIFGPHTKVGFHSYLMTKSHVGHDAVLGHHTVLSCMSIVGGHTVIGNYTYMGLNATTHQRSIIGSFCMIGANAFFKGESPSGVIWAGVPASPIKINLVGLDRHASSNEHHYIIDAATKFISKWPKR